MIRRYIVWRNRHADDLRLRQIIAGQTLPDTALAWPSRSPPRPGWSASCGRRARDYSPEFVGLSALSDCLSPWRWSGKCHVRSCRSVPAGSCDVAAVADGFAVA